MFQRAVRSQQTKSFFYSVATPHRRETKKAFSDTPTECNRIFPFNSFTSCADAPKREKFLLLSVKSFWLEYKRSACPLPLSQQMRCTPRRPLSIASYQWILTSSNVLMSCWRPSIVRLCCLESQQMLAGYMEPSTVHVEKCVFTKYNPTEGKAASSSDKACTYIQEE